MKNKITQTVSAVTIALVFISGCTKKDLGNNTTTCGIDATAIKATVNGGSFSNQTYNLVTAPNCLLLYGSKNDTLCYINSSGYAAQNSSTIFHIMVEFFGNGPGTYSIEGASGVTAVGKAYVQLDFSGGPTITLFSQSGTLNVSELGASGGKMSATFSGTFVDASSNVYIVTNGFASGIRN